MRSDRPPPHPPPAPTLPLHKLDPQGTTLVGQGAHSTVVLSQVHEFDWFSTPVAVMHLDGTERDRLNQKLIDYNAAKFKAAKGSASEKWIQQGIWQTDVDIYTKSNALGLEPGGALSDLRSHVYRAIQQFVSSAPSTEGDCDNVFTAHPRACRVRPEQRDKVAHVALDLGASWVTTTTKLDTAEESIQYHVRHDHMGWGSGISGVYYAASGWSERRVDEDGAFVNSTEHPPSTKFNIVKPFRFDGTAGAAGTDAAFESAPIAAIDPMPGTLILFPSWLAHSADLHVGDGDRISVAFNVNVKLGAGKPAGGNKGPGGDGTAGAVWGARGAGGAGRLTEMPIFIPDAQCTSALC